MRELLLVLLATTSRGRARRRAGSTCSTGATTAAPPGRVRAGRRRLLVLILRDEERLRHLRITHLTEHALRDVVADHRAELEALGVAAPGDPDVRHLRVDDDDEVA